MNADNEHRDISLVVYYVTAAQVLDRRWHRKTPPHLSHHAVPRPVDLLAVFAVSDQVKVIGELHLLGNLLQDVDAEPLTAALYVDPRILRLIAARTDTQVDRRIETPFNQTCTSASVLIAVGTWWICRRHFAHRWSAK